MLRKLWRSHTLMLHGLFEQYCKQDLLGNTQMREPCEPPTHAILKAGCDDKTSIQIGDDVPLKAVSRQSNRAIVGTGSEVVAGDHNFSAHKITPSVIHFMNQSSNPADSLYSGGSEGTGRTYVSLHDAILDPSNGWKHAAHFAKLILLSPFC